MLTNQIQENNNTYFFYLTYNENIEQIQGTQVKTKLPKLG